jgi:3-isopropylmalate/(R)-2-methylmalate dehydratase small subunit
MEKLRGIAWRFGDNIDTDQIIPARYCNTFDPEQLSGHAMEGASPDFANRVAPGDIIVAGRNFGCGSSREAAPVALKAAGVGAVIAHSFGRLFYRNAINIGLYIMICEAASGIIKSGEELVIDPATNVVHSSTTGKAFRCEPFPDFISDIVDAGGMVNYVRKRLAKEKD